MVEKNLVHREILAVISNISRSIRRERIPFDRGTAIKPFSIRVNEGKRFVRGDTALDAAAVVAGGASGLPRKVEVPSSKALKCVGVHHQNDDKRLFAADLKTEA